MSVASCLTTGLCEAFEYYEKAASLNNADGYCRMALYLANGYSGVKDADKSRECYEKQPNWIPALLL